jgi:hypothetical protein
LLIFGVSRREERRSSDSARSALTDFSPPELRRRFILPELIEANEVLAGKLPRQEHLLSQQ